jgi:hypothetical protein
MVKHDQQKVNKCLHLRTEGVAFILFMTREKHGSFKLAFGIRWLQAQIGDRPICKDSGLHTSVTDAM